MKASVQESGLTSGVVQKGRTDKVEAGPLFEERISRRVPGRINIPLPYGHFDPGGPCFDYERGGIAATNVRERPGYAVRCRLSEYLEASLRLARRQISRRRGDAASTEADKADESDEAPHFTPR
jgi:hypothetical protein